MMATKAGNSSRVWRWRRAVGRADLHSTTKQVLTALSNFMDSDGRNCFPGEEAICRETSLSGGTVRRHLRIAMKAGWIGFATGRFGGQEWRRRDYVAQWPDEARSNDGNGRKVSPMASEGESFHDQNASPDGTQHNNSPENSTNNLPEPGADARANLRLERKRIEGAFLRWLPTWPGYADHSPDKARDAWRALTPEERAACIERTPEYLRRKYRLSSPAVYLRKKAWEELPEPVKVETVHAAYCGKLWMAWWLWELLQPAKEPGFLPKFYRDRLASGEITLADIRREKGWPAANAMLEAFRGQRRHHASNILLQFTGDFRQVAADSEIYAAWVRLHERRGWPVFDRPGKWAWFPPIEDVDGALDEQVEAALAAFEMRVKEGL